MEKYVVFLVRKSVNEKNCSSCFILPAKIKCVFRVSGLKKHYRISANTFSLAS